MWQKAFNDNNISNKRMAAKKAKHIQNILSETIVVRREERTAKMIFVRNSIQRHK